MPRRSTPLRTAPPANNLPVFVGAGTAAPQAQSAAPTSAEWSPSGGTRAPTIGEPEPAEGYATSIPNLVHRVAAGKVPVQVRALLQVLPLLWFGATIWFFIQDNASGTLTDWSGVRWTLTKSGVLFLAALFTGVVQALVNWIGGKVSGR